MYARRDIIAPLDATHVFFRCHDRNYFLGPRVIKQQLLLLLAKYKDKYRVKIFDFCILDNHVHLYVRAPNAECLGWFMRTVESLLARAINKHFKRDSQALRERYKSRVVIGARHTYKLIQYIYMNRYKVSKKRPEDDYFCSAHWRLHKPHKIIEFPNSAKESENNLLANLLDDYDEPGFAKEAEKDDFLRTLINSAIEVVDEILDDEIFKSAHTIGDQHTVNFRDEILRSLQRGRGPPILDVGMVAFGGSPEHRHRKEEIPESEASVDLGDECAQKDAKSTKNAEDLRSRDH